MVPAGLQADVEHAPEKGVRLLRRLGAEVGNPGVIEQDSGCNKPEKNGNDGSNGENGSGVGTQESAKRVERVGQAMVDCVHSNRSSESGRRCRR